MSECYHTFPSLSKYKHVFLLCFSIQNTLVNKFFILNLDLASLLRRFVMIYTNNRSSAFTPWDFRYPLCMGLSSKCAFHLIGWKVSCNRIGFILSYQIVSYKPVQIVIIHTIYITLGWVLCFIIIFQFNIVNTCLSFMSGYSTIYTQTCYTPLWRSSVSVYYILWWHHHKGYLVKSCAKINFLWKLRPQV